jgi:hypothetical protein
LDQLNQPYAVPTPSPLRSMLRLWPVTVVAVALGLAGGLAYDLSLPTSYTAEVRLAVGGQTVAAQAVPGFALASQQLAADFSRYVGPQQDSAVLKQALGSRTADVVSVGASPIPESNVIRVEVVAHNSQTAVKGAQSLAQSLLTQVNAGDSASRVAGVLKAYKAMSDRVASAQVASAQASVALTALQTKLTPVAQDKSTQPVFDPSTLTPDEDAQYVAAQQAAAKAASTLAGLQVQQSALGAKYQTLTNQDTPSSDLSVVQGSAITGDDVQSGQERYGVLGVMAGLLVALLVAALVDRRTVRKKRRVLAVAQGQRAAAPFGVVRVTPPPPSHEPELRTSTGNTLP